MASGAAAVADDIAAGVGWGELADRTRPQPPGAGVLVVLTLYGGNDGLNTLVPSGDPAYQCARPDLAYASAEVHLGEGFGLNPSMTGFGKLWDAGTLAVVRGGAIPSPITATSARWTSGRRDRRNTRLTGWIGRWLDGAGAIRSARSLGSGAAAALAVGDQRRPAPRCRWAARTSRRTVERRVRRAWPAAAGEPNRQPGLRCGAASEPTSRWTPPSPECSIRARADESTDQQSAAGSAGGQGSLADQLALVARCIAAGVPTRVYSVSQGGFDTHADEKDAQQNALGLIDKAVTNFFWPARPDRPVRRP